MEHMVMHDLLIDTISETEGINLKLSTLNTRMVRNDYEKVFELVKRPVILSL
jgi:hypothetical protein